MHQIHVVGIEIKFNHIYFSIPQQILEIFFISKIKPKAVIFIFILWMRKSRHSRMLKNI